MRKKSPKLRSANKFQDQTGQSLIELLVAIALMGVLLPALLTGMVASREGKAQEGQRMEATTYLKEMQEAFKSVYESNWQAIIANGTFHPEVSGSSWTLASGPQAVGGFTRQIVISDIQRDAAGAIVTSSGTVDSSTKKVEFTVSWTQPIASSVTTTSYISRNARNAAWSETTKAEFDLGTLTSTVTTANGGGAIELAPSGGGDWATPQLVASYNNAGSGNGNDVFVSGNYAYVGFDANSTNPTFRILDITNPASPVQMGGLNLGASIKGVYVVGNYAFLATTHDTKEFVVIDATDKSNPQEVASLNLGAAQNATSISVEANYAYIGKIAGSGANRELYVIDISTPTSPNQVGAFEVGANVNSVSTEGNFTYLATAADSRELTIVNVTNKSNPTLAGSYNAPGTADGNRVLAVGTTVYLGTLANSGTNPEFFMLNAANPSSVQLHDSYEVNASVNGIDAEGNFAFLSTALTDKEFLVLDITTPTNIVEYGSANLAAVTNKLHVSQNYAYISSNNNSAELEIIRGGSGPYVTSGTFESKTFDATNASAFNYLTWSSTATDPPPLGKTTVGARTDENNTNFINASRFTTGAVPRTVKSMSVRVGAVSAAPNNQFQVGIYTDSGGVPGTLVANSESGTLAANSWNTVPITASLQANTSYWLGYNTNGSSTSVNNMRYDNGGFGAWKTSGQTFGAWPANFGPATTQAVTFSIYASFDPAPSEASIRLQLAINNDNTTWNYFGPTGTGTFFTSPAAIPLGNINGRYVRYKATFAGNGKVTPVLNEVSVNYSP